MIYITADCHGDFFRIINFCNKNNTTKDDILIILGDAGINYYQNKRDKKLKLQLSKLPITLFCIHGNHEARPQNIPSYKLIEFNGGLVYQQEYYPNLLFAKDGEIFDFNGKKTIVIGGAYSVDKYYRLQRGYNWFEDEQPSEEIKSFVEGKLDSLDWNVDCVLSHTAPIKYEPIEWFLSGIGQSTVDNSTELWLDIIEDRLDYDKWLCGHYHGEKTIDKIEFMFQNIKEFK